MDSNNAIVVKNLSKSFNSVDRKMTLSSLIRGKFLQSSVAPKFKALNNVNFSVPKGDFFGIIGRNGSGKSTLMRILLGSIYADKGSEVYTSGKVIKLAMGMGFNNNLSARDNIYINGSILGMSFKQIGNEFDEILSFAGVEDFVDFPLKNFSSGMRARLAFSIAIKTKADVFLLDEFFGGVGDIGFRNKSEAAFEELLKSGKTIVLVSHSLKTVADYCDNILLLNKGEQIALGTPKEIIPIYQSLFVKKK